MGEWRNRDIQNLRISKQFCKHYFYKLRLSKVYTVFIHCQIFLMIYIPEKQSRTSSRLGHNRSVSKCVISFIDSLYGTMITIKLLCRTGKRVMKQLKCYHTISHHYHHHYHYHHYVMYLSSFICLTFILIIQSPDTLLGPVIKSFCRY
jgi:hypothetical protein